MTPEESAVVPTEKATPERDEPVSLRVVREVAAVSDRPVTEIEPLARSIDTDALDALYARSTADDAGSSVEMTFSYEGFRVTVNADGTVTLLERR